MAIFTTDNYPNGYQPEVTMPNIIPPKSVSAEDGIIVTDKTNIYDENTKLRKKLKKVRKEKKRWKHKYLELRDMEKSIEEDKERWKEKYKTLLYEVQNQNENEWLKLKYGGGLPPIKFK